MLEQQINALATIIKDNDIQQYAGETFLNLIKAVVFGDVEAGVDASREVSSLLFHMPTVLFWDRMRRFLYGTFKCYEDQVKFAAKFENDDDRYYGFVKKQVALVNSIEEDEKIDYFAQLTRCFLLCEIDSALYFKLVHLIKNCTVDELKYVEKIDVTAKSDNNLWISILLLQGLFVQEQDINHNTMYGLSDIGKYLKYCSLNFDDNPVFINKKYEDLGALPQMEPISFKEMDGILDFS